MLKYLLSFCSLSCCLPLYAQLTFQSGAIFEMNTGSKVLVSGNLTSNTNITDGILVMNGSMAQNLNMNGFTITNLEIDNPSNILLQSAATRIGTSLTFTSGRIKAGDQDLILNSTATISGAGPTGFVWTNGNGRLVNFVTSAAKLFPVGASYTSYSPVTLTNTGTGDDFYVRVMPGVYADGMTGTQLSQSAINRTWLINEGTAGGSNATIALEWNIAEELPSFSTSNVYLGHYTGSQWNMGSQQNVSYAANVAGITRTGVTSFSPFAVGNNLSGLLSTLLNVKLFLQGYYDVPGQMKPVLANQGIGSSNTQTDNITVELRDPAAPTQSGATATAMLNVDGTAALTYPYQSTPKYIVINHRNSIQTWSANPVPMGTSVSYDFTTAATKAYGNNLVLVSPGVWAIYTADLNQDGFVDGNDYPAFNADSYNGVHLVYIATDMNGDGFVDANDYPLFDVNSYNGVSSIHP